MTCFITASSIVLVNTLRKTDWSSHANKMTGALWIIVGLLGISGPARLMIELPGTAFVRLAVVWTAVIMLFVFYSRHHSLARAQAQTKA
jgi:TM2 domain-containing membrane protein YozV